MMPGSRRLLASTATFCAAVAWLAWLGLDADDARGEPPLLAAYPPLVRTPRVPLEEGALRAISDRPLFSPDRRPWQAKPTLPPPVDPIPEAPPPARLEADLLGVVISPSGNAAVLRLDGGPSAVMTEGMTVRGWTLKRVSARNVLLASSGREQEVAFAPRHGSPAASVENAPSPTPPVRRRR